MLPNNIKPILLMNLILLCLLIVGCSQEEPRLWQSKNQYYDINGTMFKEVIMAQEYTRTNTPNQIMKLLVIDKLNPQAVFWARDSDIESYVKLKRVFLDQGQFYDNPYAKAQKSGEFQCPPSKGFQVTFSDGGLLYYSIMKQYTFLDAVYSRNVSKCAGDDRDECVMVIAVLSNNASLCNKEKYHNGIGLIDNAFEGLTCQQAVQNYASEDILLNENITLKEAAVASMIWNRHSQVSDYLSACDMTKSELIKLRAPPTGTQDGVKTNGFNFGSNVLGKMHCIFC